MHSPNQSVICHCGLPTRIVTSWMDINPGRRFYSCTSSRGNGGCNFFCWYDPPICSRSRQIVPGLVRRVDFLEKEVEGQKRREKKLWMSLFICVFAYVWKMFGNS